MLLRVRQKGPKKRVRNKKQLKNRNNKEKYFYSGKKKRHTLKSQVVVDKKTTKVICTFFGNGKKHDFRLFKERCGITDSGYTGKNYRATQNYPRNQVRGNP